MQKAIANHERAADLYSQANDKLRLSFQHMQIGSLYNELEDLDKATTFLDQACQAMNQLDYNGLEREIAEQLRRNIKKKQTSFSSKLGRWFKGN